MKKFLAAILWLFLFAALGAAAMVGLASLLLHHPLRPVFIPRMAATGAVPGILLWAIALCFAALPGTRSRQGAQRPFGLVQGLWAMGGTLLLMLCGGMLPFITALYVSLLRILAHLPSHIPNKHDLRLILACLVASELSGALWLIWYVRHQGPARLSDGSAAGIAWRPAASGAYGVAVLTALLVLALAMLELWLFPPDLKRLNHLALSQLFHGPAAIALAASAVAIIFAPLLEELLFRGIAFAGIAAKLGPGWAAILTTACFTLAHAPEKLGYPPGFAAVALVALACCWLRLRYRSIRPGMLLHFLYNFGGLLLPAMLGLH